MKLHELKRELEKEIEARGRKFDLKNPRDFHRLANKIQLVLDKQQDKINDIRQILNN
tara:strand:+ start:20 stop:190 length:171 start_codon:yes stop_codon:yes gene_type:complete